MERKAQEEAEKHQAELDEKLKRDEDERLARKKRLDEIMARTRGAKSTNSTPKKVRLWVIFGLEEVKVLWYVFCYQNCSDLL